MKIFHRYRSQIHGNYRQAYLRCGLLVGLLLAAYLLVRLLMGKPLPTATGYVSDAILLVAVFLLTAYYRNSLPDKKITLKEAMLFGMGTAVLAAAVYGISVWLIGLSAPQQVVIFTHNMMDKEIIPQDPQIHYWAAWWGIVAAVEMAILGGFGAFVAAIVFRNERGETVGGEKKKIEK